MADLPHVIYIFSDEHRGNARRCVSACSQLRDTRKPYFKELIEHGVDMNAPTLDAAKF